MKSSWRRRLAMNFKKLKIVQQDSSDRPDTREIKDGEHREALQQLLGRRGTGSWRSAQAWFRVGHVLRLAAGTARVLVRRENRVGVPRRRAVRYGGVAHHMFPEANRRRQCIRFPQRSPDQFSPHCSLRRRLRSGPSLGVTSR